MKMFKNGLIILFCFTLICLNVKGQKRKISDKYRKKLAKVVHKQMITAHNTIRLENDKVELQIRRDYYNISHNNQDFEIIRRSHRNQTSAIEKLYGKKLIVINNESIQKLPPKTIKITSLNIYERIFPNYAPLHLSQYANSPQYIMESVVADTKYHVLTYASKKNTLLYRLSPVFHVWVNQKTNYMDYIAYPNSELSGKYHLKKGFKKRIINQSLYQSFESYSSQNVKDEFQLPELCFKGHLHKVSDLDLTNIKIM